METKRCAPRYKKGYNPNYCYEILPIENFAWKNKSKGLRRHNCSSCRYKSDIRRYNKNPEAKQRYLETRAKARLVWMKKHRGHLRSIITEIKLNSGCVDCEGTFPPPALEFDHVRGTKKYGISVMLSQGMSEDVILKEIEKCEVRCAPCHRTRHKNERAAINNPEM